MSSALLAQDRSSARMRAALYALVTFGIVLILTLAEWDVAHMLSHASRAASTLSELAVAIFIAFAFRPIHQRMEGAVEQAFTKRRREARKKLFTLARTVTDFRDANELLDRIVAAIDECVGGGGSAVYLKSGEYRPAASSFVQTPPDVTSGDVLITNLRTASAPVNADEYAAQTGGAMACPMLARGELVGFLLLAASIEQLDADDRQTVMALAQSAGLALAVLQPGLLAPSPHAGGLALGNLPHDLSPLVGRERELERVGDLLAGRRLICIKGPGGIGKSRLAIRAASQLQRISAAVHGSSI